MTQHVDTAVRRHVTVAASQEHAFEVFTNRFGAWWPKEYSISEAGMANFVVEPEAGGRWYEVAKDGREYDTGRVLAIDPPERLTLAWHLNGSFQYDPDPAHASEVEVRFIAETPTRTRVELEHRGIERHGGDAGAVRGIVDSPQGWSYCLEAFATHAAA